MKHKLILAGILFIAMFFTFSCTKDRKLELFYVKEGALHSEIISLDFIDKNGNINSMYIDTLKFSYLDSLNFVDMNPDNVKQFSTPHKLDFSKKIEKYSPEYYSIYTIYNTTKAMEYYNKLFDNKIDFNQDEEYRTIEVSIGDITALTTPNFYIYEKGSNTSPSICFHEVGHRAFWYIEDDLGINFKGLSIIHMGLLEYFTVSLNNSPLVGEDCLPTELVRNAEELYKYPLNESFTLRHTFELFANSYSNEIKDSTSNVAKYLAACYASYDDEILDNIYDNHRGAMVLTSTLWRIRQSIGQEKTDKLVAQTILNLNEFMNERVDFFNKEHINTLRNRIEWCDVFYGLIQKDKEFFDGENATVITTEFKKTGYPIDLVLLQ